MSNSVSAVVVTFNRKEMLVECLISLLEQSSLTDIYVVDNCSTDGTYDYLISHKLIDHPQVNYRRLDRNTGGAGGFSEALKWAYETSSSSWFWLMDDDVEPLKGSLDKMLSYSNISKCIHPSKKFLDGSRFNWEGWFDVHLGRSVWYQDSFVKNGKDYTFVNYACFEGMLIHRDIVNKVGYPDKRFFIHDDDLVYGLLVSQYTNILYLADYGLQKKIKKENLVTRLGMSLDRPSPFHQYFNIRNHFLVNEYLVEFFGANKFLVNSFLAIKVFKKIIESLIFDLPKTSTLKMIFHGIKDGLLKNYDGHKKFIS